MERGYAAAVVELAEFALLQGERLTMDVLESEGWAGMLQEELMGIHMAACRRARPSGVELARRWFGIQKQSGIGWFDEFPEGYEEILGDEGMAEWRRLSA